MAMATFTQFPTPLLKKLNKSELIKELCRKLYHQKVAAKIKSQAQKLVVVLKFQLQVSM